MATTTNTTRTFKVHVDDEVRRFKLTDPIGAGGFARFSTKVFETFQNELTFKWKDSDGDLVTVATSEDFDEALSEQPTGPIRFFASRITSSTSPTPSASPAQQPEQQSEPVPKPVKEPVNEPVKEPVKEPVNEPVKEPEPKRLEPVQHPHVVCDGTGLPLTGTRYHKAGANYDLCETEFAKLPESEKQRYEMVLYPGAAAVPIEPVIHFGITCDGSDATPIIGIRFHRIGEDFDLCQAEFAKLDEEEKQRFEIIVHPRRSPFPYRRPEPEDASAGQGADSHSSHSGMPDFMQMLQSVATQLPGGDGIDIDISQFVKNLQQHVPSQQHHGPRGPRGGCHRRAPRGGCGSGWRRRQEVAAGEVLPDPAFGIGSFGPGVEQLQRFLIEHDLMDQAAIAWRAGLYGPWTRKAVSLFQQANGVTTEEIGRYDAATRAALLLAMPSSAGDVSNTSVPAVPEPSAPVAAGEVAPEPPVRWAAELASLNAMGFADDEALVGLLDRKHGQLDAVVAELLE